MKTSLRKFISSTLAVATTFVLTGAGTAFAAGTLTAGSIQLSDVRSGQTSNYTVTFRVGSTTSLSKVKFEFRQNASADNTVPNSIRQRFSN